MESTPFNYGFGGFFQTTGPATAFEYMKNFNNYKTSVVFEDSLLNGCRQKYNSDNFLVVLVNDPEGVKQVAVQKKLPKAALLKTLFTEILGSGLVAIEGDVWRRHRNLVAPSFSGKNMKKIMKQIFSETEKHLDELEKHNENLLFNNYTDEVSEITLRVICSVAFGNDDENINELSSDFKNLLTTGFPILAGTMMFGSIFTKLPIPINFNFQNAKKIMNDRVNKIIEKRKFESQNQQDYKELLTTLINAKDEDGENFNDQEIFDEAMTFLFGGHDTTASILGYFVYQMAKNQNIQQEIYKEILKETKESIDYEHVYELNLLNCAVKEVLRMSPPAPFLSRETTSDEEINGYVVPKGVTVNMNVIGIHYNPKYWENPEEFNPRRWENIDEKKLRYQYFPFSAGPRDCVGKNLAVLESNIIIMILLSKYRIKFPDNFDPSIIKFEVGIMAKLSNLSIQFERRKEQHKIIVK
eukprot:gene9996-2315_t